MASNLLLHEYPGSKVGTYAKKVIWFPRLSVIFMSFKVVLKRQGPVQQNIFVATNVATNILKQILRRFRFNTRCIGTFVNLPTIMWSLYATCSPTNPKNHLKVVYRNIRDGRLHRIYVIVSDLPRTFRKLKVAYLYNLCKCKRPTYNIYVILSDLPTSFM